MAHQLLIGFDNSKPEAEATAEAIGEWHESCAREDRRAIGEPTAQVIRDDPERTALGEYLIRVTGRRHGDE